MDPVAVWGVPVSSSLTPRRSCGEWRAYACQLTRRRARSAEELVSLPWARPSQMPTFAQLGRSLKAAQRRWTRLQARECPERDQSIAARRSNRKLAADEIAQGPQSSGWRKGRVPLRHARTE